MGPVELLVLIVGLAAAGFSKGLAGFGLPLIATPILAGVFGPRAAVPIVTIPIFVSNTLLVIQGIRDPYPLRRLAPLFAFSTVGAAIGTLLLASLDERTFAILMAAMVALFLARGDRLLGDDPAALRARILGPVIAFFAGLLQGTTSISGPLIGSYFHAERVKPAHFVFALAALFEVDAIVSLVGYTAQGLYNETNVTLGIVLLIPTLLAMIVGIWARGRLDAPMFRRIIVGVVVVATINLLWRTFLA